MSLFDVIKYPLSIPVTLEELESLPKEVYRKWFGIYFCHTTLSKKITLQWLNYQPSLRQHLIEIIAEYDAG